MKLTNDIREVVNDFVSNEIDSWVQGWDDDDEDMRQAHHDLDNASEWFENCLYDDFLSDNDYEDDEDLKDYFLGYVERYADETKDYLEDTYECWNTCFDDDEEDY